VTGDAPSAFFVTCRIFPYEGHTLRLSSRTIPSVSAKACDTRPSPLPGDNASPQREMPAHCGATLLALPDSWKTTRTLCRLASCLTDLRPVRCEDDAIHPLCVYRQHLSQHDAEYALKASLDPRSSDPGELGRGRRLSAGDASRRPCLLDAPGDGALPHQQRRVSAELLSASDLVWEATLRRLDIKRSMSWSTSVRLCRVY